MSEGTIELLRNKIKTAQKDFEMLQSGEWQPDNESCEASIDNCTNALALLDNMEENIDKMQKHVDIITKLI